jgi:hypothetical protein
MWRRRDGRKLGFWKPRILVRRLWPKPASIRTWRIGRAEDRVFEKPDLVPTLAAAGIDKNLVKRARLAAALSEEAFEIRMRAERQLGFLMRLQKAEVGVAAGAKGIGSSAGYEKTRTQQPPTLAEAGIDKNLAHQAR